KKLSSCSADTQVPVGLLGLAIKIMRVLAVIACSMASRLWPKLRAGTATGVVLQDNAAMGYTAKAYSLNSTSSPGRNQQRATRSSTSLEPLPRVIWLVHTLNFSAKAAFKRWPVPSG